MSHEIYYTSAPEGVKRGSSGFSTVGVSEGIAKALWDRLESLSAYRHQYGVAGAGGDAGLNPVSWAHWLLVVSGTTYHVLSRVCDSGVDHTQRTNAFAHHLVAERTELAVGGPAWLMMQPGVMTEAWDGKVGAISRAGKLPQGDVTAGICEAWKEFTGDAGWGGVLADAFVKSPTKPVCILFGPGQQVLPLLAETIALLPAATRWNVTFNTYFTSMPTSATCLWRCCLAGTPASQSGLRYAGGGAGGIVIDLTEPGRLGKPVEGPYVTYARTGQAPAVVAVPAGAAKVPAAAKSAVAAKAPAGVGKPANLPVVDDEDSVDMAPAEFEGMGIAAVEAEQGEVELAPEKKAEAKRPLLRKRITAAPAVEVVYGDVDSDSDSDLARAAKRRRRQVVMLFGGAVGAIVLATVLVVISMKTNAPPDLPPVVRQKHVPESEPEVSSMPAPSMSVPTPNVPVVKTPAPLPENDNTVVVPAPKVESEPKAVVSVPEVISHFPAVVKVGKPIEFPNVGQGISETYGQRLALPGGVIDPGLDVRQLDLQFPASKGDYPGSLTFADAPAGSLVAGTRTTDRTIAVISWKEGNGEPAEIVAIDYNKQRNAMELSWRSGQLIRQRESVVRAYWALCSSTVTLDSGKGKKQDVAFGPYELPTFSMEAAGGLMALPAALPADATVAAPADLGNGWGATWFTETDTRSSVLLSTENSSQVVKFQQKTGTPAAAPWFIVRFSPKFERMENTFAARLAAAQADLAQAESDVRAADEALERIKKEAGGKLPGDSESVKTYQGRKADATALVVAYKSAVAGYNELTQFDIDLTLPNGVKLTTVRFRRTAK